MLGVGVDESVVVLGGVCERVPEPVLLGVAVLVADTVTVALAEEQTEEPCADVVPGGQGVAAELPTGQ